MLQDIRANSQGTIAKIIIGLIVISFSIFGIESLLFSGGSGGVAEVNGEEITPFALQQELSVQQRQLLAMLGDEADPALLDQAAMSQQALDVLIQREILRQASDKLGLNTPDQAISDIIADMEQFQIDGRFSRDMFQSTLASAGFTPALFSARLSEDLQIGQLRAGLAASDFATPSDMDLAAAIVTEGRDVRYITLPLIDFELTAEVSEEEIQAYYDTNAAAFESEEAVVLEYLLLDRDRYREPVSEERLREEFELVKSEYEVPTEARVSHILIEGSGDDTAARIAEVADALAGGRDFSEAAAEYSDDIGSSQFGGDLGYTAGDTFPDSMEEAIASLAVGEISQPVETDAGTHFILVTDRREGSEVEFADVAGELEREIQDGEAGAALLRDVEELRDLAFNAADLEEPARVLELEIMTSDDITRSGGEGVFARPAVLQAAFSDDVLVAGHNSEVLELSPDEFLVLRVAERKPPSILPLDDVRSRITADLRREKGQSAAREEGQRILEALAAGTSVEDAANAAGLSWQVELSARRNTPRLPVAVADELFNLPAPGEEPERRVVTSDPENLYVLEFVRLTEGDLASLSVDEQRSLRDQLAGESGGITQQQYERSLRESADIVIF